MVLWFRALGCVWCPWVQGKGNGCSHRALPPPGPALPSSSPDTDPSLPLSPEVSPIQPLVACSCPWEEGPAWFPALPSPSASGCGHGNNQSPLLSQSHTNRCEFQHCSLCALKGLGHQDHAGKGRRRARFLLQGDIWLQEKGVTMLLSLSSSLPLLSMLTARPARAPGPLQEAITLGRQENPPPGLLPCSHAHC